jgi:hypothetical protein
MPPASGILLSVLFLTSVPAFSQDSLKTSPVPPIAVSAFADAYYAYDFNEPAGKDIPFAYNHARHNEFNVNLALLQATYTADLFRGSLGLQAGSYPQRNYAAEPELFRHIYDANAGIRLGKKLWLDAGIWGASHIGFEGAVSKNNWTLTRSLSAENTPYFETGAKLTYETGKWTFTGLVLNGWQNITDLNSNKALGSQITWKPSDKLTLNYSTFFGNEKPDSLPQHRQLHDLYAILQLSKKLGITAGFDIGWEQALDSGNRKTSGERNVWYNPTLILRYALTEQIMVAARGEYYHDKNAVIVATNIPDAPFQVIGYSMNVDYRPVSNVALRVEGRVLQNEDEIFLRDEKLVKTRPTLVTSLAVSF